MQRTLFLFTLEDVIISTSGQLNSVAESIRKLVLSHEVLRSVPVADKRRTLTLVCPLWRQQH